MGVLECVMKFMRADRCHLEQVPELHVKHSKTDINTTNGQTQQQKQYTKELNLGLIDLEGDTVCPVPPALPRHLPERDP